MKLLERVIKFLLNEKREGKESRLIALYPTQDTLLSILEYREEIKALHDFSEMRELEIDELHATIRWWKVEDGGDTKKIAKQMGKMPFSRVDASISAVKPLGDSLSLMLDSEGMQNIFSMVDDIVRSLGGPPSDYPSYLPHVALFYDSSFSEGFDPGIVGAPNFPIEFDRIELRNNSDEVFISKKADWKHSSFAEYGF